MPRAHRAPWALVLGADRVPWVGSALRGAPSQRVLRRNGFSPYGVAHSSIFLDGSWRDGLLWERILGD